MKRISESNSVDGGLESEATAAIVAFMAAELAVFHADHSELMKYPTLDGLELGTNYGLGLLHQDTETTCDRVVEVLWNFAVIEPSKLSGKPETDFPFIPKFSVIVPSDFRFLVARDQIRDQVLKFYDGPEKFDYVLANFVEWLSAHFGEPLDALTDLPGLEDVVKLLERLGYVAQVEGRSDWTAAVEQVLVRGLAKEREAERIYRLRQRVSQLPIGAHFLISLFALLRKPDKAIAVLHRRLSWSPDDARDAIELSYPSLRSR